MTKSGDRPTHFMLGPSPRSYFSELEKTTSTGKFKILLQKYWLCAQIGIAYGKSSDREDKDKWVNEYFPEPLKGNAHYIRGLAFYMEAKRKDYDTDDEEDLLMGMKKFFDNESQSRLTTEAVHSLNRYAAAGFTIISEKIQQPNDLAAFLVDYVNLLNQAPAVGK